MMRGLLIFGLFLTVNVVAVAQTPAECGQTPTHQSINNAGDWNTNADWLSGTKPAYGSGPVTIPSGQIVKISSSNFTLSDNLVVNGTMIIDGKLVMPAGNTITVNAGGKISCCTSCSASDKIDIGTGSSEWNGSTGPATITGPASVSNGVLPISLLSFKGTPGPMISLEWVTLTELNFDYFLLERSADGANFVDIGRIAGHGNSDEAHHYSFTDRQPFLEKNYYRLTSVDFDGFTEVFEIIVIDHNEEKSARMFPNPATDGKLNIELSFTPTEPVTVSITDLSGVEMIRYTMEDQNASLLVNLNPGTYIVKFSAHGFSDVLRAVVR